MNTLFLIMCCYIWQNKTSPEPIIWALFIALDSLNVAFGYYAGVLTGDRYTGKKP